MRFKELQSGIGTLEYLSSCSHPERMWPYLIFLLIPKETEILKGSMVFVRTLIVTMEQDLNLGLFP